MGNFWGWSRVRQGPKIGGLKHYIHFGPRLSGHLESIKQWASHQFHPPMMAPPQTRLDILGYHHQNQEVVQENQLQSLHGGQGESQKEPRWELLSLMTRVDGVKNCQQEKVDHLKQDVERQFQGDPSLTDKEIYGMAFRCGSLPYLQNPSGDSSNVGQSALSAKSPVESLKEEILQSSFGISPSSAVINYTDTTSGESLASLENKVEGKTSALRTQDHQYPENVRDVVDNKTKIREQSIKEECLMTSSANEEFVSPDKGGVAKDLNKMANRALIDLEDLEEKLDVAHLDKESQHIVRNIEKKRFDSFARKGNRVGSYKKFIYDLPVKLDEPIMASRRYFDKEVVEAVYPAFQELLNEGVICEAGSSIKLVSNLLPVAKPSAEYALS